ncbi:hypothetical protein ACLB2K_058751 [Fragaria x ananassa]
MAAALTPPPSSSTTKVTTETARNAVHALLKWRATKSESQKPDLLDSDELLYLVVTLKKIPPKGRVNAYKVPLPTPLHSHLTEFCLIYDDRPKSKLTKPQIQAKIKAENLPVVKILKYTKLKSDYKAFESKRKLMNSYDMFLADKQIVPLLPRLLGKHFFKKKRIPVPVDLLKKNWKEQIERICGSAMLFLSTGTCCVVRVARSSMSEDEIVENVVAAIQGVVEIVPGNWGGVRSLHLKLLESIALPVYQTVPDEAVKVEGSEKAVEEVKEVGKAENKESKKEKVGKRKGMIHQVRYLDSNAGEVVVEEKSGKDGVGEGKVKGEDVEKQLKKSVKAKDDVASNVEKPLKKSVKAKDDVASNAEKPLKKSVKVKDDAVVVGKHKNDVLSAKDKKKDVTKKKGDELAGKGEEAVGKKEKRKSEPVKLKSEEAKPKTAKRSKKGAESRVVLHSRPQVVDARCNEIQYIKLNLHYGYKRLGGIVVFCISIGFLDCPDCCILNSEMNLKEQLLEVKEKVLYRTFVVKIFKKTECPKELEPASRRTTFHVSPMKRDGDYPEPVKQWGQAASQGVEVL